MGAINRVSDLGTQGIKTIVDGAVTQSDLSSDVSLSGMRNLLINGDMMVHQRTLTTYATATSLTSGSGYYAADRWKFDLGSGSVGTWKITTNTDSDYVYPYTYTNTLTAYCVSGVMTPPASSYAAISQIIEARNLTHLYWGTSAAKPVTLSFWVRSSMSGTYIVELVNEQWNIAVSKSYTITTNDTWQYVSLTFPPDDYNVGYGFTYNNNSGLKCNWYMAAGSDYQTGSLGTSWHSTGSNNNGRATGQTNMFTGNFSITYVQLEAGSVPTPFEQRPIGVELALCQRYYYRLNYTQFLGETIATLQAYSSTGAFGAMPSHPVTMRSVLPTVGFSSRSHFNCTNNNSSAAANWSTGSLSANAHTILNSGINMASVIFTAGNATVFASGSTSAWIDVSAEL